MAHVIERIKEVIVRRRGVARDVAAVAGSRLIRQGVMMVAMAIAARVLGKELLGVWAMIYIVIQFGVLLSDSGISTFVVQNRELTDRKYSTAFYLSTGLAVAIALVIAAIGIPLSIALGFRDYSIQFVAAAVTVIPLTMNGLLQSKLRRDRRFTTMFVSDASASATLLAGTVIMLTGGYQLWAFIVPTIVAAVVGFTVCVIAGGMPRLGFERTHVKEISGYSLGLVGFSSVNYWARNVDHVLIGKFLGAAPLGVYSFAYRIMMLPLSQINATAHTVALPYLSPHQDSPLMLRQSMRKIFVIIAMLTTVPMIWVWVERDLVVDVVLGPKWGEVGDLLLVLAPLGAFQALVNPIGLCFQVSGKTNRLFQVGMVQTAVTVVGFAVGVWMGSLMSVVTCYAVSNLIVLPLTVGSAMKTIGASLTDWLVWVFPFLALLPLCYGASMLVPPMQSVVLHAVTTCSVTGILGAIVYAWVARVTFGGKPVSSESVSSEPVSSESVSSESASSESAGPEIAAPRLAGESAEL